MNSVASAELRTSTAPHHSEAHNPPTRRPRRSCTCPGSRPSTLRRSTTCPTLPDPPGSLTPAETAAASRRGSAPRSTRSPTDAGRMTPSAPTVTASTPSWASSTATCTRPSSAPSPKATTSTMSAATERASGPATSPRSPQPTTPRSTPTSGEQAERCAHKAGARPASDRGGAVQISGPHATPPRPTPLFSIGYGSRPDFREGVRFAPPLPRCQPRRLYRVGEVARLSVWSVPPPAEGATERRPRARCSGCDRRAVRDLWAAVAAG